MLYYRIINNKLETTVSNYELPEGDDWIYYEEGKEPKELKNLLDIIEKDTDLKTKISEAKQYLLDTNWYYIRKIELGKNVPDDIVKKRLELIQFINDNK